MKWKTYQE